MIKILILGAGISGLSAAMELNNQLGLHTTLIDQKNQVGGLVKSENRDGFFFELGPRTLRMDHSDELLAFAKICGLEDEIITSSKVSKKRYIGMNRFMWGIEPGPKALFKSCIIRRYIPFYIKELFVPRKKEDESVYDFFKRRFSKRVANNLIDPMTHGIYGTNPKELSISAAFPIVKEWEMKHGSVIKGAIASAKQKHPHRGKLFSFKNGLSTLTEKMKASLKGDVITGEKIIKIEGKKVITDKNSYEADYIICALPAAETAKLLGDQIPELKTISSASVTTVNLGYDKQVSHKQGFGFLVPSKEKRALMGCVFDSDIFENDTDQTKFTAMLRDDQFSDEDAVETAINEVRIYTKIKENPVFTKVTRYTDCIPKYSMGHLEKVAKIKAQLPPHIFLAGNYLEGAALNTCAITGIEAAKNVLSKIKS